LSSSVYRLTYKRTECRRRGSSGFWSQSRSLYIRFTVDVPRHTRQDCVRVRIRWVPGHTSQHWV